MPYWRIKHTVAAACVLGLAALTSAETIDLPLYSQVYDPARDPYEDSNTALDLARQSGRRVLIALGGDWCQWCHQLDRFLADNQTVNEALHQRFVLLKINVSDANDNADFLAGLPPTVGYPHLFVARRDGNIIHAQDTSQLLDSGQYSPQRVLTFVERWRIPDEGLGTFQ